VPVRVKGKRSTLHAIETLLIRPPPDDGQVETSSTSLPIRSSGDRVMPAIIPLGDEIAIGHQFPGCKQSTNIPDTTPFTVADTDS
jgi:hypothetical protein